MSMIEQEQDHFRRAEDVFNRALELAPAQREPYVRQACGNDRALAARVRRLISLAERAPVTGRLLAETADSVNGGAHGENLSRGLIGATIGRYRIVDLIGEGGFGAVYHAQQEAPVQRPVALKILHGGMSSAAERQVVARFQAERQALAVMEHPNIARVFDAGQTDPIHGARPYFVMELVTGEPITDFCDQQRLDWRSRLELFMTVCQAAQHAHQKGVIHRDLKPSNILVSRIDGVATPKIIDFGIAKAVRTGGELAASPLVTQRLELLGTPQYMSPEQADPDGQHLDTRTDIYSLGVVLYELLTGSTPLDHDRLSSASYSRIGQVIREQAIERPSTRLTRLGLEAHQIAQRQGTDAASLRKHLRGDLDWIALKALDPVRDRRYGSASELADDIRRCLNHEPVLAGPPTAAYRLRKFVRRHRVGVLAAALVGLALVGGAIGTTVGMVRARESAWRAGVAAQQASAINEFMRDVLTSVEPDERGADVRLVEVLDDASRTASQRFAGHPVQESDVRLMLAMVYNNLDLQRQATQEYEKAVALLVGALPPNDRRVLFARVHYARSLLNRGLRREARQAFHGLVAEIQRALGVNDKLALEAEWLAASCGAGGEGRDQALATLRDLRQRAAPIVDDAVQVGILNSLINVLKSKREPDPQANQEILTEVEMLAREMAAYSERLQGPHGLQTLHAWTVVADMMVERGDWRGAADICSGILASTEGRLGPCHVQRMHAMDALAEATHHLGDAAKAADLMLQVIQCTRAQGMSVPLLATISDAMRYLDRGGRWREGEALAREYAAELANYGGGHDDAAFTANLYIARFISLQDRPQEAEPLFEALHARRDEAADKPSALARLHLFHGSNLIRLGSYDQAHSHMQRAVELVGGDVRTGTWSTHRDDILIEFIALYEAWGKPEQARELRAMNQQAVAAGTHDQ